jgi:hypothetical protein
MKACDLIQLPSGRWYCPSCDPEQRRTVPLASTRLCSPPPDLVPAARRLGISLSDVGHYAQALARWTLAGFPVRDPAEVERIERELCRPCAHYVAGRCAECGCRVNQSSLAVANKIAMATERCPKERW